MFPVGAAAACPMMAPSRTGTPASATGAFAAQSVGGPVRVAPATPVDQARLRGSVARRVEWTMKRRVPGWGVVTMRATPATSPDPPAIERGQPRGGRADLRNEH